MGFFTLVTQVSSRFDHLDSHTSQTCEDPLIPAYGSKCLEKKIATTSATLPIERIKTMFKLFMYCLALFKKLWQSVDYKARFTSECK